jgi:hypothetical protein
LSGQDIKNNKYITQQYEVYLKQISSNIELMCVCIVTKPSYFSLSGAMGLVELSRKRDQTWINSARIFTSYGSMSRSSTTAPPRNHQGETNLKELLPTPRLETLNNLTQSRHSRTLRMKWTRSLDSSTNSREKTLHYMRKSVFIDLWFKNPYLSEKLAHICKTLTYIGNISILNAMLLGH